MPDKDLTYHVLWKVAREVSATFEFAARYVPGSVAMTGPVEPKDLVSHGTTVILGYTPEDFDHFDRTVRMDMLDEAKRLMRQAGWLWDRDAQKWSWRQDDVAAEAPWLFGHGSPNDSEAEIFVKLEGDYPALVAYARSRFNATRAAEDLRVSRRTFDRRLADERLAIVHDAEAMAALKAAS
jgi:hypothetical protein